MSFGNILEQILQDGMGGRSQIRNRLGSGARNLGGAGSGAQGIFSQLQGALAGHDASAGHRAGSAGSGGFGGMAEMARDFLRNEQAGGMTGGQIGGIGAAAGALLGGGLGGAARGGAMAILGTLALSALRNSGAASAHDASETAQDSSLPAADPEEVASLTGPDTERLLIKAMIDAAKADGNIDQSEMEKIVGKLDSDQVSDDEKAFVVAEMRSASDPEALAAQVRNQPQAAEVYAAAIMTISIDSQAEKDYLRRLAKALNLDAGTVDQLHQMTNAPAA